MSQKIMSKEIPRDKFTQLKCVKDHYCFFFLNIYLDI